MEMRQQLDTIFNKMARPLLLRLWLDSRPVSVELEHFITALTSLSDKLELGVIDRHVQETFAPCVEVCLADGMPTGLAFHGVPSGHEFTSFVLGLYNAAGPGQAIDEDTRHKIAAITKNTDMKILVTLSCTMCPDLVKAAQRIAVENPFVTAQVYDIHHFEEIKKRFNVMSVPCLVIGDETISFGKKNIHQILDLLAEL
jgi:thioredoxin reductase (NADPH)